MFIVYMFICLSQWNFQISFFVFYLCLFTPVICVINDMYNKLCISFSRKHHCCFKMHQILYVSFALFNLTYFNPVFCFIQKSVVCFVWHSKTNDRLLYETQHWAEMAQQIPCQISTTLSLYKRKHNPFITSQILKLLTINAS